MFSAGRDDAAEDHPPQPRPKSPPPLYVPLRTMRGRRPRGYQSTGNPRLALWVGRGTSITNAAELEDNKNEDAPDSSASASASAVATAIHQKTLSELLKNVSPAYADEARRRIRVLSQKATADATMTEGDVGKTEVKFDFDFDDCAKKTDAYAPSSIAADDDRHLLHLSSSRTLSTATMTIGSSVRDPSINGRTEITTIASDDRGKGGWGRLPASTQSLSNRSEGGWGVSSPCKHSLSYRRDGDVRLRRDHCHAVDDFTDDTKIHGFASFDDEEAQPPPPPALYSANVAEGIDQSPPISMENKSLILPLYWDIPSPSSTSSCVGRRSLSDSASRLGVSVEDSTRSGRLADRGALATGEEVTHDTSGVEGLIPAVSRPVVRSPQSSTTCSSDLARWVNLFLGPIEESHKLLYHSRKDDSSSPPPCSLTCAPIDSNGNRFSPSTLGSPVKEGGSISCPSPPLTFRDGYGYHQDLGGTLDSEGEIGQQGISDNLLPWRNLSSCFPPVTSCPLSDRRGRPSRREEDAMVSSLSLSVLVDPYRSVNLSCGYEGGVRSGDNSVPSERPYGPPHEETEAEAPPPLRNELESDRCRVEPLVIRDGNKDRDHQGLNDILPWRNATSQ